MNWKKRKLIVEIVAALFFLFVLLLGAVVWRVSTSPLDVGFAKAYVEHALSNSRRGTYARMDSLVLHWPDLTGPLLLNIQGAKIYGPDNVIIVGVDEASISLSKAALLIGYVRPVALILKKPELTLIRNENVELDIGFGKTPEKDKMEKQEDLTGRILDYIAHPGMEADSSPLATLQAFEIQGARVNYEDRKSKVTSYLPEVNLLFEGTNEGLDSTILLRFSDKPETPSVLRGHFLIPWDKKDVVIDAYLENFDVDFLSDKIPALAPLDGQEMVVNARLYGLLDSNFLPVKIQLTGNSPTGAFMIPEFSAEKVPYKDFAFEASYDRNAGSAVLSNTHITMKDVTLNAEGALKVTPDKIEGPLKLSIDEVKQAQLGPLWPVVLEKDAAKEWIIDKMSEGTFHDVSATVDLIAAKTAEGWSFDADDAHAAFAFEGMSVNYRPPMIPVKKAKGQGIFTFAEEKLAVTIDSAMIGDMKVNKADLEFVNIIEHGAGKADMRLIIDGPLKTGLEYLSKEPIKLDHKFDLAKVKGNAKAIVNVSFPTHDIDMEDVKVSAEGVISDITLPGVMKTLELTGGPYDFAVKDNLFTLNGKGQIGGQPVTLDYAEFLNSEGQAYKNKITANINVDVAMRTALGMDLSDFLDGAALADVVYTEFTDGKAEADVKVDLTPSYVFFKPFSYEKLPGVKGSATLKATLMNGALKEISDLQVTAPEMEMKNSRFGFSGKELETKLASGDVPSFVVGETVAKLGFTVNAAGQYDIKLDGSFLDLRPFLDTDETAAPYDEPPMKVSVAVDRMRASEGEPVQHARLYIDIDQQGRFNQLELDGIAGKGDVLIRYKPDETGKRVFEMNAADAGATLRAFGVYENIIGGVLRIHGEPIRGINDRNVKGVAEITNFKVVRAPTLARLLGILSLPGVISMLTDEGLTFTKLEAEFDWLYRPRGSILRWKDGRTSGNSVGFTFDGTYDKSKNHIDVEGTIIPLSGVNKVIGSIPLVGDILTGGSGGVFAATYSIKGDTEKPQVFVNPLSVLTPGILRRILFEQN